MIVTSSGLLRKSSVILRNFRKMFGNVRVTLRQVFRIFENWAERRQIPRLTRVVTFMHTSPMAYYLLLNSREYRGCEQTMSESIKHTLSNFYVLYS